MQPLAVSSKLSYLDCEFDTHFKVFHELMSIKVSEVLLVASAYDAYILEEDGSLASKIINEYRGLNLSRPPRLTRVDDARTALDMIDREKFDLVITMPHLDDMDSFDLGAAIKKRRPDLPVILLAHSIQGLYPLPENRDCSGIDQIYVWAGDADLLLAIVKSVEDRLNVDRDTRNAQVRIIILVEDSPLYRSYFLPLMYKEVVNQTQDVLEESLNEEHRLLKMRARPKVLVAESFEAAIELVERYRPYLFGVISDTRFFKDGRLTADAGYQLLTRVKREIPDLPLLLLSSESQNREKAARIPAEFLDKNSPRLFAELHQYFLNHLGFGDFVFRRPDGSEVGRAANLRSLEAVLPSIPDEPLCYHAMRNRFSNWIMARSEIVLASRLRQVQVSDFGSIDALRQYLIDSIHALRKWRQKGVVAQFNPGDFDPRIADFVKIGKGSLGGKARGLAFVANLLRKSPQLIEKYKNIDIQVPPTLVITTDVFDDFIQANDLGELAQSDLDDARITEAFVKAQMPDAIRDDLAAFLDKVHHPLSVRSSSLLEDAHHHPFAGLYKTLMIPNNHPDDALRLAHLLTAIKMVYASTWFVEPRKFTRSTAYRHRKEQMAVMVQQMAGRTHGDYFYPAISGVARSQNYYPIGRIQPDDGMAKIALGFGKIIESGRSGLRFCPRYPHILPDFSKVDDILSNAQHQFYALRVKDYPSNLYFERGANVEQRQVVDAAGDAPVKALSSTYVPDEHRIRDTAHMPGQKVLTFASILKHKVLPLPELLSDLLDLGRKGMGCHVEFEFSLNLAESGGKAEFSFLQMRPMSAGDAPFDTEIDDQDRQAALCYSTQALGHGQSHAVADIVYVRPEIFDPAQTVEMARQVARINAELGRQQRPYLLIGPGRWGSFDRWLGIPVKWEDISAVGAIVELRNTAIKADPSHGSHFFQNITTHGLPYLTITENSDDIIRWDRIETLPFVEDHGFLRHVRCDTPLLIKCDGRNSQCVILQ